MAIEIKVPTLPDPSFLISTPLQNFSKIYALGIDPRKYPITTDMKISINYYSRVTK